MLATLPHSPEQANQELALQLTLGPVLIAIKGWATPEVERAYLRARELCQQGGQTSQLFLVLWGLWVFYYVREELHKAHDLAEQLLAFAQEARDPTLLMEAHMALGTILHPLGEFLSARKHLEQCIALYDPHRHRPLAYLYGGADAGMRGLTQIAWTVWMLGYPDQALECMRRGITLAQDLSHPHSLAFALCFAAELHQFRREAHDAQERAEEAIRLSTEQGFPFWLARGTFEQGWALAEQGQAQEGIAQIRQGLTNLWATGANLWRACHLGLLAEVYGKAGRIEEGLAAVTEALEWMHSHEGPYYEAELYRLKGELTLQQESKEHGAGSKNPKIQSLNPSS